MSTAEIKTADVRTAIARCQRELATASRARLGGDTVECRNALERLQHRAYEAKALFQGEGLPTVEELGL